MKIVNSISKLIPCLILIVLAMAVGTQRIEAYPAPSTCDSTGCHFDIRTTDPTGEGSITNALAEGCGKPGNHLVEFSRLPAAVNVIKLKSQLSLPGGSGPDSCKGTFNFSGMLSREVVIDGSDLPKGKNTPDGKNCALYLGTGKHQVHNMTFVGAPLAICAMGDDISVTDNNFGIKRDGSTQGNDNGLFIHGSKAIVLNNVFAGNSADGLIIQGHQNLVQKNYFGVTADNFGGDKGNGGAGIRLIDNASKNVIGYITDLSDPNYCSGDCSFSAPNTQSNAILYNKKGGVILSGTPESTRNSISGNVITGNTGLGIDLNNDGPSLPVTGAVGPNNMMPLATQVQTIPLDCDPNNCVNPTNWLIRFKAPPHAFYEIYKIGSQDASDTQQVDGSGNSYGEGDVMLSRGQANVGKDGYAGVPLASSKLHLNDKVSILLRDEQGNTSEFSSNIKVTDQPTPPIVNKCGNGTRDDGEQCDPTVDGTCCSPTCLWIPEGDPCNGQPGTCSGAPDHTCNNTNCGNGTINPGEDCDDGANNGTPQSCCTATCTFQPNTQTCDDGTPGLCAGTSDTCTHNCGNGTTEGGEQCDDGANNGTPQSCCTTTCTFQPNTQTCDDGVPGVCAGTSDTCTHNCGNGTVDAGEDCDTAISGACCDPTCHWVPDGGACNGTPGTCDSGHTCNTTCGNGTLDAGETCDDGNTTAGDGCDATCNTEPGWTCPTPGMPCQTTCGDGIKTGTEQCDDGNTTAGDGCDATCNTEPGWTCTGSTPTVCTRNPVCGNGSVESGEACDDGNTHNGDGCSSVCTIEPGYTCIGSPSVCNHTTGCGDGLVQGTEQCDGGPCCNVPGCTFKPDGTTCDDAGNTCLAGVCQNTNPGTVFPPGGTGPMAIEGGGFCSLAQNASDANALMMVLLDFIGAASIGVLRLRKSRRK